MPFEKGFDKARRAFTFSSTALTLLMSAIDVTIQNKVVHEYLAKGVTNVPDTMLNIINHVGDATNGFIVFPALLATNFLIDVMDFTQKNKFLQFIRKSAPFLAGAIMTAWIIDAETARLFPLSNLSVPSKSDIPAGLFGVMSGLLLNNELNKKK